MCAVPTTLGIGISLVRSCKVATYRATAGRLLLGCVHAFSHGPEHGRAWPCRSRARMLQALLYVPPCHELFHGAVRAGQ